MDPKQKTLAEQFRGFEPNDQQAITNFFNLHNAAGWIYTNLSQLCKDYIDQCIEFSKEANEPTEEE